MRDLDVHVRRLQGGGEPGQVVRVVDPEADLVDAAVGRVHETELHAAVAGRQLTRCVLRQPEGAVPRPRVVKPGDADRQAVMR